MHGEMPDRVPFPGFPSSNCRSGVCLSHGERCNLPFRAVTWGSRKKKQMIRGGQQLSGIELFVATVLCTTAGENRETEVVRGCHAHVEVWCASRRTAVWVQYCPRRAFRCGNMRAAAASAGG